jgi:hypothetical protein
VAKLHGSALELRDNNPGLRVVMSIPLDATAVAAREVPLDVSPPSAAVASPSLASLP